MALYGGLAIFGRSVAINVLDVPSDRQETAYAGLHGVESIDLGSRGRYIEARGIHVETTKAYLTAVQNIFRSYKDNVARPLVDTSGYTWPYCILEEFNPDPAGRKWDPGGHGSSQKYTARFRSLT